MNGWVWAPTFVDAILTRQGGYMQFSAFFRRFNYIQYRRPDVVNVTSNDVVMIFAAAEARSHKRYYNKLYDDNPNLSDSLRQVTFWAYTDEWQLWKPTQSSL